MPIHDVAVDPIRTGLFDAMNFVSEIRKIGGEDGGCDDNFSHGVME
jgi:hypothetical protein